MALSIILLVIMLSAVVLSGTFVIVMLGINRFAECCYTGCRSADVKIHAPSFVNIRENVV
jgi:hypothetical protein